ncbi:MULTISPECIES: response regulator transcription factor [Ochrobactrum]|uniref:Response regulator transcription factor n=1 Tax=Ochrobactrum quorumnocens TaxID=271865 RepID=A0A5N1JUA5_9HYPH|nr:MULTISPECIES: response regulator [Brucella/Ochrobactrum group]KAA9367506.1 response regulator transcription factor [[Ochrobactrum] quorumnocens]MBD7992148.1 response regulator transcription factor [Ochrobactrum gallinarum]MDH7792242.1 FixJ family two-component response regulator [Ochrobactrum sp. AN78]
MAASPQENTFVYIIDDDRSVRQGLDDLFASIGMTALSFSSVRAFLDYQRPPGPACLILDVRMPVQTGTEFFAQMSGLGIDMPVIFITGHGDIAMGVRAMRDGAADFLSKPFREHDLLDAVHRAIEAERKRLHNDGVRRAVWNKWQSLTVGERDVFALVVQGLLNKQIAGELGIKEITVKVRRAHVMQKMQAGSLAELVRLSMLIADADRNPD